MQGGGKWRRTEKKWKENRTVGGRGRKKIRDR